jgi:hypothetical protein
MLRVRRGLARGTERRDGFLQRFDFRPELRDLCLSSSRSETGIAAPAVATLDASEASDSTAGGRTKDGTSAFPVRPADAATPSRARLRAVSRARRGSPRPPTCRQSDAAVAIDTELADRLRPRSINTAMMATACDGIASTRSALCA